ncbi:MFS transporter [Nocardia xishanensis]
MSVRSIAGFMLIVEFFSGFIQSSWSPLVPSYANMLNIGAGPLNWLNTVGLLGVAVSVPVLSALGDRYGHRRLLIVAIWIFTVGMALVAFAPSYLVALIGNALWGVQGAWLVMQIALLRDKAKGVLADRAIALLVSALTGGMLLGGLTGGPLLALIGNLRLTLCIPVVLGVVCALIAIFLIPESTTRATRPIDWVGAIILSLGLVSLLLGLIGGRTAGWGSATTVARLGIGVLVVGVWVAWELRTPAPLVDLRLVTSRALWPAMVAAMLFGTIYFGPKTPMLTFLATKPDAAEYGLGFSAPALSLVMSIFFLAQLSGSGLCALITSKIGLRGVVLTGTCVSTCALATMAAVAASHGLRWILFLAFVVLGLGAGLMLASLSAYISAAAPSDQVGTITGASATLRGLGGSIGTAIIGTLLSAFTAAGSTTPTESGYSMVWFFCAGGGLLGMLLMLAAWSCRRQRS